MLINIFNRAKELASKGIELFASPALRYFLYHQVDAPVFRQDDQAIINFVGLDDNDIWCALKGWATHSDKVLSVLSKSLVDRNLFKIEISNEPFDSSKREPYIKKYAGLFNIEEKEAGYFVSQDEVSTNMYSNDDDSIDILFKGGNIKNIAEASDMLNIQLLSKKVKKYYFCHYKPLLPS